MATGENTIATRDHNISGVLLQLSVQHDRGSRFLSGGRQETLTSVCPRGGWFSREADRKSRIRDTICNVTMVVSEPMVEKPTERACHHWLEKRSITDGIRA